MKRLLKIMLLAAFLKTLPMHGQTLAPEIAELRTKVVRIDTNAWGQSLRANPGLYNKLKSFTVIGLGEQTHGTHEFYRNKSHFIELLVNEFGFRRIGLEAPMAETVLLNEYVQTGQGNVKDILKSFRSYTFETQEFVSLVEWAKGYNRGKQEKIQFFGFDFQSPFACLDYFGQYGKGNNPQVKALVDSLRGGFLQLNNELYSHQFDPASFGELSDLSSQLLSLLRSTDEPASTQKTTLDKYIAHYRQFLLLNNPDHGHDMAKLSQVRDSLMARNVLSHLQTHAKQKVVLWAHNAHLQKTPNAFSASMGQYLHQALKSKYAAVGQTTSTGYYTAFSQEAGKVTDRNPIQPPAAPQMEYYFQAVGMPVFILDLAGIKSRKLKEVNHYKLLVYGATDNQVMPGKMTDDFDLVIHTDSTTGAKNFYVQ